MKYYLAAFKKYGVFEGRARRKEFWFFMLINSIIYGALTGFGALIIGLNTGVAISPMIPAIIYFAATLLPGISVTVRRLHDIGKPGWFYLLHFIPTLGTIALLILLCFDGNIGPNAYGDDPLNRVPQS